MAEQVQESKNTQDVDQQLRLQVLSLTGGDPVAAESAWRWVTNSTPDNGGEGSVFDEIESLIIRVGHYPAREVAAMLLSKFEITWRR